MDVAALRAFALDTQFEAHGVAMTVTVPNGAPVPIEKGIWLTPELFDGPGGLDIKRRESRRGIAIRRSDVAEIPSGTLIQAVEVAGGPVLMWKVVGFGRVVADHWRVIVILVS